MASRLPVLHDVYSTGPVFLNRPATIACGLGVLTLGACGSAATSSRPDPDPTTTIPPTTTLVGDPPPATTIPPELTQTESALIGSWTLRESEGAPLELAFYTIPAGEMAVAITADGCVSQHATTATAQNGVVAAGPEVPVSLIGCPDGEPSEQGTALSACFDRGCTFDFRSSTLGFDLGESWIWFEPA